MAYFTQIKGITNTVGTYTLDSAGNYKDTYPVSGSVAVSGLTGSIGATILNGEGVARDSWLVSAVTATIAAALIDSSGIQYSGSNPIRISIDPASGTIAKQEDSGHTSGDVGVMMLGVRNDANATLTDADMDYIPVSTDLAGRIKVASVTASIGATILNGEGVARDSWVVSGITNTIASNIVDSSGIAYSGTNPVPVTITSGATATTAVYNLNAEGLYRDTFPVQGSVAVSGVTGSISVTQLNGDGTYKDTQPVSGSVSVSGITGSIGATILNGEGIARDSWLVSGITATIATANVDSSGIQYSGSNPLPFTLAVSNATTTINAVLVDSTGIYRGTLPVAIVAGSAAMGSVTVNGTLNSIIAVGPQAEGATFDGAFPQLIGGVTRTSNPVLHGDVQVSTISLDPAGRQLVRPLQVRNLIASAYASYSTGTEATLLAAVAGKYHDLIYVLASNNSTVAVGIDIRAVLAGNILLHLEIPANSTTGLSLPVPMFGAIGDASGNAWTVDLPDITGTTVYVSALFSQEI
jgi:hypothetical protein